MALRRWAIKKLLILIGLFLMVFPTTACGARATPANISFECTLKAEEMYVIGEPVNIRFSLHNPTERTLYIPTWYTPLEGIAGKIFFVTRDGDEVPY